MEKHPRGIFAALKMVGFERKQGAWVFPGMMFQADVDLMDDVMAEIGLERSPALSALAWYNRGEHVLVRINGETGKRYTAEIVTW